LARDAIQKLQEENLGLKIDVAGKQAFINQLVSERQQLMAATQDLSYRLGAAETKVAQLAAPRRTRTVEHPETPPQEEGAVPSPVGEGSAATEVEAGPAMAAPEQSQPAAPVSQELGPKRSMFGRMFGGK